MNVLSAQELDSTGTGTLVLDTNLEEFYLIVDDDVPNAVLAKSSIEINLQSGIRKLTVSSRYNDDYSFELDIPASDTLEYSIFISLYPRYPKTSFYTIQSGRNLRILTDKESVIFIDGREVTSHYSELFLPNGSYELRIDNPDHGSLNSKLKINSLEVKDFIRFNEEPSRHLRPLNIIPGFGQIRKQQHIKAGVFITGVLGLGIAAIRSDALYSDKKETFDTQFEEYLAANTVAEARSLRLEAESTLDEMQRINNTSRALALGTLLVYTYSIFDSFQKPKSGYRGPGNIDPSLVVQSSPVENELYPQLSIRMNF
ncbi:MAG: hypothetical protein ED557_14230 [Balneola sp.]|nr:MAG: hypothetical protein ED557_14230 [Balneola sp.]